MLLPWPAPGVPPLPMVAGLSPLCWQLDQGLLPVIMGGGNCVGSSAAVLGGVGASPSFVCRGGHASSLVLRPLLTCDCWLLPPALASWSGLCLRLAGLLGSCCEGVRSALLTSVTPSLSPRRSSAVQRKFRARCAGRFSTFA
jgi:hypothetical protein